jgi:hypothetical protein
MNEKHKLDTFFKGKLQNLHQQPSSDAWDKLQGRMKGKKKALPWWSVSVAASFLLMAALGGWWWSDTNDDLIVVENQKPIVEQQLPHENNEPTEQKENDVYPGDNLVASDAEQRANGSGSYTIPLKNVEAKVEALTAAEAEYFKEITVEPLLAEAEIINLEIKTQEPMRPKALRVIYKPGKSAEEIEGQRSEIEEPIKEIRGLQKFVALARDLKEGELSIGELRDAKDDLLAINLKGIRSRINDQIFDRDEESIP